MMTSSDCGVTRVITDCLLACWV